MRPQQQNRRMRGRNNNNNNNGNNNRKGPNPLTRSYESNGPDVKIRGSAQQIAEKYTTLARDAQSSGDRVMAENYLQHAEHYNRIIMAAQGQMPIQARDARDEFDDEDGDERDEFSPQPYQNQQPQPPQQQARQPMNDGSGPQPVIEGMPAEVALGEESAVGNNNGRQGGHRDNREPRDRDHRRVNGNHPRDRRERQFQPSQQDGAAPAAQPAPVAEEAAPPKAEVPAAVESKAVQPEPAAEVKPAAETPVAAAPVEAAPAADAPVEAVDAAAEQPAAPRRARRPRRPRKADGDAPQEEAAGEVPVPAE